MGVRSLATSEAVRRRLPAARGRLERSVVFGSAVDPGPAPPEERWKAGADLRPAHPPMTARGRRFHREPRDLAVDAANRWSRRPARRT